MNFLHKLSLFIFIYFISSFLQYASAHTLNFDKRFIHPGLAFSSADLELMKSKVELKENPWLKAFTIEYKHYNKESIDTTAFVHIVSGPYSNPDIGGKAFERAGRQVHDLAILWYISRNDKLAEKAMSVIESWMKNGIWSFDENNAKLLAAETCYYFCNAAEILRCYYPKWTDKHTKSFSHFLMSSIYPVIRYYYPKANGNWDGANIRALMCIAIFTDNSQLFNNALNHFKYSHSNGSLVKYIYPDGQCQESTRDQGHVQMGLELFASVARIAYTQGINLFTMANSRLALGFEYTCKYLYGEEPHCYGIISPKKRDDIRSNYIHVLNFYKAMGYSLPYTEKVVKQKIEKGPNTMDLLTSMRAFPHSDKLKTPICPSNIAYHVGAKHLYSSPLLNNAIKVFPGQSIQDAVNSAAKENKTVLLMPGQHLLTKTLFLPTNSHVIGCGKQTIVLGGKLNGFSAISLADFKGVHNITLENFILEAAYTYGTEPENGGRFYRNGKYANQLTGINFSAHGIDAYSNITLKNISVHHYSRNGVVLAGVKDAKIIDCDFTENGSHVVPGPRLSHNLKLCHVSDVLVKNTRLDTSIKGAGIYLEYSNDVVIDSCEIARNAWFGICVTECNQVSIKHNLLEGNDNSAIYLAYQSNGSADVSVSDNIMRLNNGNALTSFKTRDLKIKNNTYDNNAQKDLLISKSPTLLLEDLSHNINADY